MRFEVFTSVKVQMLIWVYTNVLEEPAASIFRIEPLS
jgi:hypothetical protein